MGNEKPVIRKEDAKLVFDGKFVRVFDLEYEPGKHYMDATRRKLDDLAAVKTEEEFKKMLPDAVSCVLILDVKGQEPLLCLSQEYRFPAGQYLLSVPAGLLDPEDAMEENPAAATAKREIMEETGICVGETDEVTVINPLLFSTPGMTDESNALVQVVLKRDTMPDMTQEGAVGGEKFDGFVLLTKEEAMETLKAGRDREGIFYSVYTWMALMCFVTEMWR